MTCRTGEIRETPSMLTNDSIRDFNERDFYLAEFRGRSIGVAWPPGEAVEIAGRDRLSVVADVISELARNGSRVVVLSPLEALFARLSIARPIAAKEPGFVAPLWRALRERGYAGLRFGQADFDGAVARVAVGLRLAKVVWIRSSPPVVRVPVAGRVSVVDLPHLEALLDGRVRRFVEREIVEGDDSEPDMEGSRAGDAATSIAVAPDGAPVLAAIRQLIEGGIPAVNVCAPEDLAEELFTYDGAGTFFTRDRYADVRPLALDDFDLARDLIARGEADGFLAPRDDEALDAVLTHGVGVFIEGRYLAGIGAILPYPDARAAELACLFALTRYVGEGVGGQIVRYAIERGRRDDLDYLFACTTSDRVVAFFARHGFRSVDARDVPSAKWRDYAAERRARVRCLRFELARADR